MSPDDIIIRNIVLVVAGIFVLAGVIFLCVAAYQFWQMARENRKRRGKPPVAPEIPEVHSDEWAKGYNSAALEFAGEAERAGNLVLAWQLKKRIKS